MKILMVEDNQTLCEMMAMFFKKEKWEAGYAQDGVKAVEMFKKDPTGWDIVLLDLNAQNFANRTDHHADGT